MFRCKIKQFTSLLQVRDDYLKDRMAEYMQNVSLEQHLGLGLVDLLRLAKEVQKDAEWMKQQDPER